MSTDWLRYQNQGAIRSKPLAPGLIDALSYLPEMGIEMRVFSGGQAPKGSGGARTGSTRHDHGNAADADFYYQGRKLDWNNPDDVPIFQEMVQRGKQRGVTGWGAGDDYMGAGRMHVGFGNPGVWGAGGSGANAPGWLREAYHGEPGHNHKPGDENQKIADATMAAIGKAPITQSSGGGGTPTAIGSAGQDNLTGGIMADTQPEMAGGILGSLFPSMTADRKDRIALALSGMTLNPNRGLQAAVTGRMAERADSRKEQKAEQKATKQRNVTIDALRNAGVSENDLQMAQANPAYMNALLNQVAQAKTKTPTPYSDQAKIMSDLQNGLITKEQANAALTGAGDDKPEYGLTPQYVTRPDGSLGMIQLGKDGSVNEVELPEGMALQKGVEKLDLGTAWQWYNTVTAEPIGGPIPKDNRGAAAETAAGTVEGKDEATKAIEAPGVIAEAENLESLIDSVITDPALPSVVGNVQGRLPAGTPFNGGQAGANVQAKIDQIGGKAFLQAFESLKGGGQITEREGAAAQAAMARMNQTQDQATFTASLRELQAIARNARLRAQGQEVQEYTGSAPSSGAQAAPSGGAKRLKFNPETGQIE